MKILCFYLFYIISQIIYCDGQMTTCTKKSVCSCLSDIGLVDLTPLTAALPPRFKDVADPDGDKFSWNPCSPFSEGNCTNVAVCERTKHLPPLFFSIGTQESATFSVDNGKLTVTYSADTQDGPVTLLRNAVITLVCDASQNPGTLTAQGEVPAASGNFIMTLNSVHACPKQATAAPFENDTIVPITLVTHTHQTLTPAHIVTPSGQPATLSPPHHVPNADLVDIKQMLVGQVIILVFIMIFLLILTGIFGYRTCVQGGKTKTQYDNL